MCGMLPLGVLGTPSSPYPAQHTAAAAPVLGLQPPGGRRTAALDLTSETVQVRSSHCICPRDCRSLVTCRCRYSRPRQHRRTLQSGEHPQMHAFHVPGCMLGLRQEASASAALMHGRCTAAQGRLHHSVPRRFHHSVPRHWHLFEQLRRVQAPCRPRRSCPQTTWADCVHDPQTGQPAERRQAHRVGMPQRLGETRRRVAGALHRTHASLRHSSLLRMHACVDACVHHVCHACLCPQPSLRRHCQQHRPAQPKQSASRARRHLMRRLMQPPTQAGRPAPLYPPQHLAPARQALASHAASHALAAQRGLSCAPPACPGSGAQR